MLTHSYSRVLKQRPELTTSTDQRFENKDEVTTFAFSRACGSRAPQDIAPQWRASGHGFPNILPRHMISCDARLFRNDAQIHRVVSGASPLGPRTTTFKDLPRPTNSVVNRISKILSLTRIKRMSLALRECEHIHCLAIPRLRRPLDLRRFFYRTSTSTQNSKSKLLGIIKGLRWCQRCLSGSCRSQRVWEDRMQLVDRRKPKYRKLQ